MKKTKTVPPETAASEPWKDFQVRERSMDVKRDAVLRTAAYLFLEMGYHKTSMSVLATRLEITKPSLYYYFRNKEQILVECYRAGIAEIESHLQPATVPTGDALARLRVFVHGYATAVLTHYFGRCVAMIDDSELSTEARRGVRELKRRVDASIRSLVEAGMEDGSMCASDPKLASFAIAGAINWAGTWYRPEGALSPEDIAQAFTTLLTRGLDSHAGS